MFDIKKFFSNLISPKRPKETFVVKVTPEMLQNVPSMLKKELGMKDAIIVKLEQDAKSLRERIEYLEGKKPSPEEELAKQVKIEKKKIEKKKIFFRKPVFFSKPYPTVVTYDHKWFSDGKSMKKYLCGLEFVETEKGFGYNLLVKTCPDDKKTDTIVFKMPLEAIFVEPEYTVSKLKTGQLRTRIDSNGKYHEPEEISRSEIKTIMEMVIKDPSFSTDDKIKNIVNFIIENPVLQRQLMTIRKSYEDKITELNDDLNGVYNQLDDALRREEKMKFKIKDAEIKASHSTNRAELNETLALKEMSKEKSLSYDLANLLMAATDRETGRLMAESNAEAILNGYKSLKNLIEGELSMPLREILAQHEKEKLFDTIKIVEELMPSKMEVIRGPATESIKVEKKEKKEEEIPGEKK